MRSTGMSSPRPRNAGQPGGQMGRPGFCNRAGVPFLLRDARTGRLIRRYPAEGPALAFVRDVVRLAGRAEAARFVLVEEEAGRARIIAEGAALVGRALEDRVL